MTDSKIPEDVLHIQNPEKANEEILAFAQELTDQGKRPWFEIRYPAPAHLPIYEQLEWKHKQEAVFDAVEVIDGEIKTLPPYVELLGGAE